MATEDHTHEAIRRIRALLDWHAAMPCDDDHVADALTETLYNGIERIVGYTDCPGLAVAVTAWEAELEALCEADEAAYSEREDTDRMFPHFWDAVEERFLQTLDTGNAARWAEATPD